MLLFFVTILHHDFYLEAEDTTFSAGGALKAASRLKRILDEKLQMVDGDDQELVDRLKEVFIQLFTSTKYV